MNPPDAPAGNAPAAAVLALPTIMFVTRSTALSLWWAGDGFRMRPSRLDGPLRNLASSSVALVTSAREGTVGPEAIASSGSPITSERITPRTCALVAATSPPPLKSIQTAAKVVYILDVCTGVQSIRGQVLHVLQGYAGYRGGHQRRSAARDEANQQVLRFQPGHKLQRRLARGDAAFIGDGVTRFKNSESL